MASTALTNLSARLKDIDQLLNAHTAITKFQKAERAAQNAGGQLAQVAEVFNALVTDPGPGKPKEVDAINRAAFVLSMAHFQGFVDELHAELGAIMLKGKADDPVAVIKLVKPPRSNPHVNVINQMFSGIGVYELMDSINWQKCDNKTVKSRLTGYLETRNKIAHGSKESITKGKVSQLKQFIELLAGKLEEKAASKATVILGKKPW
ncbi:MAG TPA: HEPN domain-containing protein [Hydrogenophaga sp.]|uniref:HEPN domain-containing protein n=1 Tax=Hydrogenophaga sp. TaxID=1904254 RepID=UPI002C8E59D5|nr:HEPN domain-containing protein [Hydrogenophaga sp.]HMN94743.1 HEPN domain-containing protein [Hydrogenophaga sp.]HMP09728.1 HEPN domain-containing protein [Hydrogenophaga sp.]